MKKLILLPTLMVTSLVFAEDTAYSPPVGGMTLPAAASTDTFVSVALATNAAWVGTVASVSGSDITVAGAPGWTANVFVTPGYHYARLLSGAQAGHYVSIISNSADTLSVDAAGLNLSTIAASDKIEIAPYWTLGTLYPASQADTAFTTTTNTFARKTQLLFFNDTAIGINRSAAATYYFYSGAWRKVGQATTVSYDNTIVYPDTFFIQRNVTFPTALIHLGRVQPGFLSTILTASTVQNDNYVALAFPMGVTLDGTGLAASGFTASTNTFSLKDQLLWFDPSGTGTNRSSTYTYFYYNGAWRRKGESVSVDFGPTVLATGSGFIIRKAANGITAPWTFSTGY
ncbi:MAG: TIGR02597 family protein [Lacunisphaera sp.]|nr:TIGR02597 family protein [Lacunisphaera sp.]